MLFGSRLKPSWLRSNISDRVTAAALTLLGSATMAVAQVTATHGYDLAGNTVTVAYADQTCVVHTYDSSGNRTATTITNADVPETPVWGVGIWGCNEWTP
jgi:YD repeat-containing protein